MLNRILISVSIALFTITIIEIGYLFFYKSPANTSTNSINSSSIEYLSSYSGNILTSAIVTAEFEGIIVNILNKPGTRNSVQIENGLVLEPINKTGNQTRNSILFRKTDLPALKVYEKFFFIERRINFSDLKKGDSVTVKEVIDLKKDPLYNRLLIKIVKL